ncbi:MAG TPA: hypothetical protein VGI81_12245 [Tepidisphaeraceae bacterium]|jgi:hypothetical protein
MWNPKIQTLRDRPGWHIAVSRNGALAAFADVLRAWQSDAAFRAFFLDLLASAPFPAYRWETPPVTKETADRPFEFVLLGAPGLDRAPDPEAFAKRFAEAGSADATVLVLPNLGNDADLVVPRPTGSSFAYGHLASFVRHAPVAQKHELWRVVGAAMEARIGTRPVWLSTAGMGVPWLHVRLDDQPKYYGYAPYARPEAIGPLPHD